MEQNKKKFEATSIVIKLMLLYGFSYDIIIQLKVSDYDLKKRTLEIEYERNGIKHICVELPYLLAQEIEEYLKKRNAKENQFLFVSRQDNPIGNSFIKDILDDIKVEFEKEHRDYISTKNQFTPTGLQKYAIIQMILSGMNQSIIMDFTGQKDLIYNDCQKEVNMLKEIDRNRYVNHMMRGIATYDLV